MSLYIRINWHKILWVRKRISRWQHRRILMNFTDFLDISHLSWAYNIFPRLPMPWNPSHSLTTIICSLLHKWASWWFIRQRICLQCRRCGFDPRIRKTPGEGIGYSLQYSCLENSMDRGDWWARVHWISKRWTWLSMHAPHRHHIHSTPVHALAPAFSW